MHTQAQHISCSSCLQTHKCWKCAYLSAGGLQSIVSAVCLHLAYSQYVCTLYNITSTNAAVHCERGLCDSIECQQWPSVMTKPISKDVQHC